MVVMSHMAYKEMHLDMLSEFLLGLICQSLWSAILGPTWEVEPWAVNDDQVTSEEITGCDYQAVLNHLPRYHDVVHTVEYIWGCRVLCMYMVM